MRQLMLLLPLAAVSACASANLAADRARGEAVATSNCAACHAVGASGDSPAPEAPAFRRLEQEGFRTSTLENALLNGVSSGHPAMPNIKLSQRDTRALIAYLRSVQTTSQ